MVCRSVVLTLGAAGALRASAGQETVLSPAHPVDAVVDTTGAGDEFAGALAAALAAGGGLGDVVDVALAAAARVVSVSRSARDR